MMSPTKLVLLLALPLLLMIGCAPGFHHTTRDLEYRVSPIHQGTISTEGVRIVSDDGPPFTLTSDQAWDAPFFQGEDCLINPEVDNFGDALANGARRVRVYYPGHEGELYGVLSFCGRVDGSIGPAARSYQILIPPRFVAETAGGRATVLYEYHNYDRDTVRDNGYARAGAKAWILWLSQVPLDESMGRSGGETIGEVVRPRGSRDSSSSRSRR